MSKKIFVGRLAPTTTEKQLSDHFAKAGAVVSARIVQKIAFQSGPASGYVIMSNDNETKKAITTLNNTELNGSRINVIEAHALDQERPTQYYNRKKRRF